MVAQFAQPFYAARSGRGKKKDGVSPRERDCMRRETARRKSAYGYSVQWPRTGSRQTVTPDNVCGSRERDRPALGVAFPNSPGRSMKRFSSELIAVLAVGAALAGLVIQQGDRLDSRIDALAVRMNEQERRTDERFQQLTVQTNEQYRQLTVQMNEQYRQLNEQTDERFRQLNEQTDERFRQLTAQMNERFQQVDEQFRQVGERFRQIDERFRQIDEQFRSLSERVARIEGKFDLFETVVARRNETPTETPE